MSEKNENQETVTAGSELSARLGGEATEWAVEVLAALAKRCAEGKSLTFEQDWGYGSGTIVDETGSHTHIGLDMSDMSEDDRLFTFIRDLHSQLCGGCGLGWVNAT